MAKEPIPKNANIIAIAREVFDIVSTELDASLVRSLKDGIERNEQAISARKKEMHRHLVSPEDYLLAVALMKVLARKNKTHRETNDLKVWQAATWPSEQEMKDTSWFYWESSDLQSVWFQSGLTLFHQQTLFSVKSNFEKVIFPQLKRNMDDFMDDHLLSNCDLQHQSDGSTRKKALWNTFVYALSLSWSRSHKHDTEIHATLIPVVELFNGQSERVDRSVKGKKAEDETAINVEINRGFWPFIGGGKFINKHNLPCSAVHATRDIQQGEELIISYGDLTPLDFAMKYGTIPKSLIQHHDIDSWVCVWMDPKFVPIEPMRVRCLEQSSFLLDEFRNSKNVPIADLVQGSLERHRGFMEPDEVKNIRQFLILSMLADEEELHRNYNTGRLRGQLYEDQVLPLMCAVMDYNITLLGESTSKEDFDLTLSEDMPVWKRTALLARVVYRECLLMWKHTFIQRAEASGVALDFEGCNVCGRSYPSKKCSRCMTVQYCSQGHQRLDWKHHKSMCKK